MLPLLAAVAAAGALTLGAGKPNLDTNEYLLSVQVTASATQAVRECADQSPDLTLLENNALTLLEYETSLPQTENRQVAAKEIIYLTGQIKHRKMYTTKYCQHKLSEIQSVSRTLSRALGGKHQFDICDSDFTTRFYLYQASYVNKEITLSEFTELVNDIVHIVKTDQASCSTDNQAKLNQTLQLIKGAAGLAGSL